MSREGEIPARVEEQEFPTEAVHDESPQARQNDQCCHVSPTKLLLGCSSNTFPAIFYQKAVHACTVESLYSDTLRIPEY